MAIQADYAFEPPAPPWLVARCRDWFQFWGRKRRWMREMRDAAALGRLDAIIEDVGMTRAELDDLISAPPDAGRQFERLAQMEGVDLNRLPGKAVRQAIWKCVRCPAQAACRRWLYTGVWQRDGDPRCPNAELLRR